MNNKDKVVDEILKGLADYKPQAEPDWDSFYTHHKNDIFHRTAPAATHIAGKQISPAGLRNTAFAIVALAGIIASYFLFFGDTTTITNENQIISTQPQTNPNTLLPNTTIIEGNEGLKPSNQDLQSPALPGNEIMKSTGSGAGAGSYPAADDKKLPTIVEPQINQGLESLSGGNENVIKPGDTLSEQPVYIKKTVIITDTVKITRPHKK